MPQTYEGIRFDSDSHQIGVDNHSSYSISNNLKHFTSPITPFNVMLLGVNGKSKVPGTRTICWMIDDDFGVQSKIVFQNILYVPASPICLPFPQHWDQCDNEHFPTSEGTWCVTYSKKVVLHWSQLSRVRTIPKSKDQHTHLLLIKWSNPYKILNDRHGTHVRSTQNRTHSSIKLIADT